MLLVGKNNVVVGILVDVDEAQARVAPLNVDDRGPLGKRDGQLPPAILFGVERKNSALSIVADK